MDQQKNMTGPESMELITSMINRAKNGFGESGYLYLVWGWVILSCCIIQFAATYIFNFPQGYYIWFVTWLVLIYQIFFMRNRRRLRGVTTYTGEINSFVWIAYFICLVLMIFVLLKFNMYPAIFPAILIMYGMPTFLSGIILKFKPLSIGGICCWLFAILSTFVDAEFQLLLIACGIIAAWIVPGYLLKAKFQKEN